MSLSGFDDLYRKLNKMAAAARKIDGNHQVNFSELFHPVFMLENTNFASIDDFFGASPFEIGAREDLEAIDENALDAWVREKTRFQSWSEMKQTAGNEWVVKKFKRESD
jgi:hypothetical protein